MRFTEMEYKVTVRLGNEAMQNADDVAEALRAVANRLRREGLNRHAAAVWDANGNRVGQAKLYTDA
jgi:hypothetical protein